MIDRLTSEQVQWLDSVYREFADKVFATCLQFAAGDRSWAQDRVHDVFIKLARDRKALENVENPGGWIYRCTVNTCLMALRRKSIWRRIRQQILPSGPEKSVVDRHLAARRDLRRLAVAIRTLTAQQRAVLTLVHFERKSQTEVAELLSLSRGQVSKLHSAALARLEKRRWETIGDE